MFTAETAITEQTSKQNCVEGWNTVTGSGANATIQFDEAENAVSLSSTSGSWYNATLYYCTKENAATASKYTLTFDLKASEACDIQLALMPCIVDNLYFVQDNSSLSPVSYSSATTEWITKTLTFDLSKIKTKRLLMLNLEQLQRKILPRFWFTSLPKQNQKQYFIFKMLNW